jgi:urease accessory protein UreF
MKALEDTMEESIIRDEQALAAETVNAVANGDAQDPNQIQRLLQENKVSRNQHFLDVR